MVTRQTIVIIGTGSAGRAIATSLAGGNFNMLLCDEEFSKSEALANELRDTVQHCNAEAMLCTFDCAWEADIIVLALNMEEQKRVAAYIKDVVTQKILISIVQGIQQVTTGISFASCQCEALQELLPNTKLVNVVFNYSINDEPVFVTGDDLESVDIVFDMLQSAGIKAVLAERLAPITGNIDGAV